MSLLDRESTIAVCSRSFSRSGELRSVLLSHFPNAHFNDSGLQLEGDALLHFLSGARAAIVALETISSSLLDSLPALKVISKYGVGLNNIDLEACKARGVQVLVTAGTNSYSVAELVISTAIQLLHRIPESSETVRGGVWQQHTGRDLRGSRVGIIGCGYVGKQVALLARSLGCEVVAHDIRDYSDFFKANGVEPVELDDLLRTSDVVTVHLPLDQSTVGLLGRSSIELLKSDAVILNYARGGIVNEDALAERLRAGTLTGAGFDVFENEPKLNSPLRDCPRVILSCHIGGSTVQAVEAMGRAAISQLIGAVVQP